jgi:CheY-like chemotaxis protein
MLEKIDFPSSKLYQCENGEIGLNTLKTISDSKEKIVVFLDLNMPILDGWGFLDGLKQNKYYNLENLSVFIVSSSTDESDMTKAKENHIVKQFIHKPMGIVTIKEIIAEV